jgi:hypothetical protein
VLEQAQPVLEPVQQVPEQAQPEPVLAQRVQEPYLSAQVPVLQEQGQVRSHQVRALLAPESPVRLPLALLAAHPEAQSYRSHLARR